MITKRLNKTKSTDIYETESANSIINNTHLKYDTGHYNKKHFRYWVNGSTGNDANSGLRQSAPFKTLKPVLEKFNSGNTDVRAYIDAPGTYDIQGVNLQGITFHLSCYKTVSGDVKLNFTSSSDKNFAFYNCHLNIQGTAKSKIHFIGNPVYIDNGTIYFKYVSWQYRLKNYGGSIRAEYCTFSNLYTMIGLVYIYRPTFKVSAKANANKSSFIESKNSRIYISGNIAIDDNNNNRNTTFTISNGSALVMASSLPILKNKLKNFITSNDNTIQLSKARYNTLSRACTAIDGGRYNRFVKM